MDSKLVLVKAITLLYRESEYTKVQDRSTELVNRVLTTIKQPEAMITTDYGRDSISSLRETLTSMCNSTQDNAFDRVQMLQQLRVNVGNDESLFYALKTGIDSVMTKEENQKLCKELRRYITDCLDQHYASALMTKATYQTSFAKGANWRQTLTELIGALEPLAKDTGTDIDNHPARVGGANTKDVEAFTSALVSVRKEVSPEGIIRFGKQGFNRHFGINRGISRTEFMVLGALQHNYKSGRVIDLHREACIYNQPYMINADKTPLNLRLTFENDYRKDYMAMFSVIMEQRMGCKVDTSKYTAEEIQRVVDAELSKNGYESVIEQFNPSDFTYMDLMDLIRSYQNRGYELHLLTLDYLNMISKKGCTHGANGFEVRDLYRRVRNFTTGERIACITPHQLSADAKRLTREGIQDEFVSLIANKGYYDSCSLIDQEVDIEIYQHLVKAQGRKFCTTQRGKHRGLFEQTPEQDLYCVYEFSPYGGILDDIYGDDMSRRKIGATTTADGGGTEWWA